MAGDDIRFTYMNADAPTADEVSDFQILFDGTQVAGDTSVRVQSSMATALGLKSAETVSADADAAPLAITVELQDSDGNMRGMGSAVSCKACVKFRRYVLLDR